MKRLAILFLALALSSCTYAREAAKTTGEPPYTDSGFGVTIWKIPVVGIGGWGSGQAPSVIIHKYEYQTQPAPPGAPPPPPAAPPGVNYPTVYPSAFDDPTLVIFQNRTYWTVRIEIDGNPPIRLAGYQASANLYLGPGDHRVRAVIEKPTQVHGTLEVVRIFQIQIRPEGRSQIVRIYDG